jgi:hypothetical protein
MNQKLLFLLLFQLACIITHAQSFRVHGKITNNRLEPLAFVTVQVKDWKLGTATKEDGTYELEMEPGKYDLMVTMVGYKPQVITIIVGKGEYVQNIIMEEDIEKNMSEVIIRGKAKDRSEEIMRLVIHKKETTRTAAGAYSCDVYIKAIQEDSSTRKARKLPDTASVKSNSDIKGMSMAEVILHLDRQSSLVREERSGITKRGDPESLFYLSTTDGEFDWYSNLIRVPALSTVPFLSPVSYSGLIAYRFKLIRTYTEGKMKLYTISVKPRQLSNATVEGEITIADSLWVIIHTKFRLPAYHLPEYDFFEVEQQYELIDGKAWMPDRQSFTYFSKGGKTKKSGHTIASFRNFSLNKTFDKKYFGTEVSATTQEAYERDSSFWEKNRPEPLTIKEVRFIHYRDSIYRASHTKSYLDSMDKVINKITWKKLFLTGQVFSNHEKERLWYMPTIFSLYQPFQFGGSRIYATVVYNRVFKSRKWVNVYTNLSYGLHNHDVNGSVRINRLYNPFNRGHFSLYAKREFEPIFSGDAWII